MKAIFKRPKTTNALVEFGTTATPASAVSETLDMDREKTVDDALAELKDQMDRFQKEVDLCAQERLGRVEQTAEHVKMGTLIVAKEMRGKVACIGSA